MGTLGMDADLLGTTTFSCICDESQREQNLSQATFKHDNAPRDVDIL